MALWVGKLSRSTTEEDVEKAFSQHGKLVRCALKKGYAFVSYQDDEDADKAVRNLNGTELKGSDIIVERAKPRSTDDGACFKCGQQGHWARDCTERDGRRSRYSPRRSRYSPDRRRGGRYDDEDDYRRSSRYDRRRRDYSPRARRSNSREDSPRGAYRSRSPPRRRTPPPRPMRSPRGSRSPRRSPLSPRRASPSPRPLSPGARRSPEGRIPRRSPSPRKLSNSPRGTRSPPRGPTRSKSPIYDHPRGINRSPQPRNRSPANRSPPRRTPSPGERSGSPRGSPGSKRRIERSPSPPPKKSRID